MCKRFLFLVFVVCAYSGLNAIRDACDSALEEACGKGISVPPENSYCCNTVKSMGQVITATVTAFCPNGNTVSKKNMWETHYADELNIQGHPCLAALKGKKAAFALADDKFQCYYQGQGNYFPILPGVPVQLPCQGGGASRQCANYKWVNAIVNDNGTVNFTVTKKSCGQN